MLLLVHPIYRYQVDSLARTQAMVDLVHFHFAWNPFCSNLVRRVRLGRYTLSVFLMCQRIEDSSVSGAVVSLMRRDNRNVSFVCSNIMNETPVIFKCAPLNTATYRMKALHCVFAESSEIGSYELRLETRALPRLVPA